MLLLVEAPMSAEPTVSHTCSTAKGECWCSVFLLGAYLEAIFSNVAKYEDEHLPCLVKGTFAFFALEFHNLFIQRSMNVHLGKYWI
jgi:hypothetical protein